MLKRLIRSVDWVLVVPLLILACVSVVSIHSATGGGGSLSHEAKMQGAYILCGFFLALLVSRFGLTTYTRLSILFYLATFGALMLVLLFAPKIAGSQRWLIIGGMRAQPSEFIKIAIILVLARLMQGIQPFERLRIRRLINMLVIVGMPSVLVLIEPDLGTALVILGIGILIILLCNVDRRIIPAALLAMVIMAPLVYQFGLKDYQRKRVIAFLDPMRDPQGSGYNAIQSMIGIGSGRFFGKGYLKGTQSRLNFIPEQHTDFIFSAFAEEWGFVGVLFLLGLFSVICVRIYGYAADGPNAFATVFCLGYCIALSLQVFINISMVAGLLPIVGLSLPFVSAGGSSLISNYLAIGVCLGIKRQQRLFEAR